MTDQPDDNNSDQGPKVPFKPVNWQAEAEPLVVVPGPVPNVDDEPRTLQDVIQNGLPPPVISHDPVFDGLDDHADYNHNHDDDGNDNGDDDNGDGNDDDDVGGSVQPAQEVAAVDSPDSSAPVQLERTSSTIGDSIAHIRDSLDLGRQRLSRQSSAVSPLTGGEDKMPHPNMQTFSMPMTLLQLGQGQGRGRKSHALNVVQPYPNPSGLKRVRTTPVDHGPCRQPLLKSHTEPAAVMYLQDGNVMITSKPPGGAPGGEPQKQKQQAEADNGKAKKAARRFSLVKVVSRIVGKDKPKGKGVAHAETGGAAQQIKATVGCKGKGNGKAVEFVEAGPSAPRNEQPEAKGAGPAKGGGVAGQQETVREGKGKGKVTVEELVPAGQSAPRKGKDGASGPQVGATQEARGGGNSLKPQAFRKVREAVGRHWKLVALTK